MKMKIPLISPVATVGVAMISALMTLPQALAVNIARHDYDTTPSEEVRLVVKVGPTFHGAYPAMRSVNFAKSSDGLVFTASVGNGKALTGKSLFLVILTAREDVEFSVEIFQRFPHGPKWNPVIVTGKVSRHDRDSAAYLFIDFY
jgi:hypothetical protein